MNFRERLAKKGVLIGTQCFTGSPAIVEILGFSGWDWVSLDMEHAVVDFARIEHLVLAATHAGVVPLVRVAENDPVLISKALDTGAAGIIVPHVSSREELDRAVAASQYGPQGMRGACTVTRATSYGAEPWKDHVVRANRDVVVIPMIEDQAGIDAFDQMLAAELVPAYWLAPTDLAASLGCPGADFRHPKLEPIARDLRERAQKAGKELMISATPHMRADYVRYLVSVGFRLISIGTDLALYRQAAVSMATDVRA
jgi:2-keto-3-deoxy-L-rhamnonate aldolase RhmA